MLGFINKIGLILNVSYFYDIYAAEYVLGL